jgi:hypothetical protein
MKEAANRGGLQTKSFNRLFLAVLFHMSHGSFVGMISSVKRVSPCGVRMMGGFFVVTALMMLGSFTMVTRGMGMVLCRLLVVLGCFLGHGDASPSGLLGPPATTERLLYDSYLTDRFRALVARVIENDGHF